MIKIIAAIGKNNELGKNNSLIWHLPLDMKLFRQETSGKTVIMGRLTYLSIGRPLPKRRNIVISRDENLKIDGAETALSLDSALALCKSDGNSDCDCNCDCYIIGGAQIYAQALPLADELILTEVDAEYESADVYFPRFDRSKYRSEVIAKGCEGGISFKQIRYTKE